MASLEGTSSVSLLASTDSEGSSQHEEEVGPETDDEHGEDKFLAECREEQWELYRSINSSLLLNDHHSADVKDEPGCVKTSIVDLQKNLNEWKRHHSRLIDQFGKLKSNSRRRSVKITRRQSRSFAQGSRDTPDTDHDFIMQQEALAEKEREVTMLKKKIESRDGDIGRLTSDNESLEESRDGVKMKLDASQHRVDRLERDRQEAEGEVERLKRELVEERLARKKEKLALEKDKSQLQRKLEGEVQQYKEDMDSSHHLLTSSQEEVGRMRAELVANRSSLTRMLGALQSATIQISALSEQQDSRPRSSRKTSHKQEMSEYEAAAKEMEVEVQAHFKQWEMLQAVLIRNSSQIAGLTEAKKKLEEDLHKKIEEVCQLEARLKEVRDLSSRAEANQDRLKVAVADYKTEVRSLRQERDKAKMECQKTNHEKEILEKDLGNERAGKVEMERLYQKNVGRLEARLSEEKKNLGALEANLGEQKRLVQTLESRLKEEKRNVGTLEKQLSEEKRRVKSLEARLGDEKRYKEELMERQQHVDSAKLGEEVEKLKRQMQSLARRNRDLQDQYEQLTNHLKEVTEGDIRKLGSLEKLIRQIRNERDDLESKSFVQSLSSSPSLTSLEQMSVLRDRSLRHLQSSPFHYGSSVSLNSRLETRTPAVLAREDQLQNSRELLQNGAHHHHPSAHSVSQEVFSLSSTESEKDSPTTSRHSMELEKGSPSQFPDNRQSPKAADSSSASDND